MSLGTRTRRAKRRQQSCVGLSVVSSTFTETLHVGQDGCSGAGAHLVSRSTRGHSGAFYCPSVASVLLSDIQLSAFRTRSSTDPNLFVRTHSAIFFISLVVCTAFQGMLLSNHYTYTTISHRLSSAVGGLLTSNWIRERGVHAGAACTTQGAL